MKNKILLFGLFAVSMVSIYKIAEATHSHITNADFLLSGTVAEERLPASVLTAVGTRTWTAQQTFSPWVTIDGSTVGYVLTIKQNQNNPASGGLYLQSSVDQTGSVSAYWIYIDNNNDGVPPFVVRNDKNVGVGIGSPRVKFHVNAPAGTNGPIMQVSTATSRLFEVTGSSAVFGVPLFDSFGNPYSTGGASGGGGGGSADNLGTHIATKTLDIGNFAITNASNVVVNSTGTEPGIILNVGGVPGGGVQKNIGGLFVQRQASGPAADLVLFIASYTSAQGGGSVLTLKAIDPSYNDPILRIVSSQTTSNPAIRIDGGAPNIEIVGTTSDTAHGLGSWEIAIANQGTKLQLNSRSFNNSTYETAVHLVPLSHGGGIEILPATGANGDVENSTNTSYLVWQTTGGSTIGQRGPRTATASWTWMWPNTDKNAGQLIFQRTNAPDRELAFTTAGVAGLPLINGGTSFPFWGFIGIQAIGASGTPDGTTFLRGDGNWATPSGGGGGGGSAPRQYTGNNNDTGVNASSFTWIDANGLSARISASSVTLSIPTTAQIQTDNQSIGVAVDANVKLKIDGVSNSDYAILLQNNDSIYWGGELGNHQAEIQGSSITKTLSFNTGGGQTWLLHNTGATIGASSNNGRIFQVWGTQFTESSASVKDNFFASSATFAMVTSSNGFAGGPSSFTSVSITGGQGIMQAISGPMRIMSSNGGTLEVNGTSVSAAQSMNMNFYTTATMRIPAPFFVGTSSQIVQNSTMSANNRPWLDGVNSGSAAVNAQFSELFFTDKYVFGSTPTIKMWVDRSSGSTSQRAYLVSFASASGSQTAENLVYTATTTVITTINTNGAGEAIFTTATSLGGGLCNLINNGNVKIYMRIARNGDHSGSDVYQGNTQFTGGLVDYNIKN